MLHSNFSSKAPLEEEIVERTFMVHAIENLSSEAYVNKKVAEGTFKKVWRGKYLNGPRKDKQCIGKEFKQGSLVKEHYFQEHLNNIEMAHGFIQKFNQQWILPVNVLLSVPEVWTCERTGHKGLVEPMIENYQKFNSNSGAVQSNDHGMQALSHFSYHSSNGSQLLCDIQGGLDQTHYVLTEPVIMSSVKAGTRGPADLGPEGILAFFKRHHCRHGYCKKEWLTPEMPEQIVIPEQLGTSMVAHLPDVFEKPIQKEGPEVVVDKEGRSLSS